MNEDPTQTINLSSRKRRIAAFLIDHILLTFLMVGIVFIALGPSLMDDFAESAFGSVATVVMFFGMLIYFAKDSINGISIGKWIMGIAVRDVDDATKVPSFGKLFMRNLFVIIWFIEFLVLAGSLQKRRLGDKVAKTIVIKNQNKPTRLIRIVAMAGLGIFIYIATYVITGTTIKNSTAYFIAVEEIESDQGIIEVTGGIEGYGMLPTGSISIVNGMGQANLEIKVLGKEKDIDVFVNMAKTPYGEWKLIDIYR